MPHSLQDKFRGCLLGGMLGDIAGAVVEAESPGYIAKTYRSVDDILCTDSVPEFSGPDWRVGRFTDDTQMTLCVAEWLIAGEAPAAELLLARFAEAWQPWRRYGPGTETILRMFPQHRAEWRSLSTAMFPEGSHGNGSAMRVAPIGLARADDLDSVADLAIESSRPTHSHALAYQGAVLQATAVATAVSLTRFDLAMFLGALRKSLRRFDDLLQSTTALSDAIDAIENGLARGASCLEISSVLGTGVSATEAVPMAIYCFVRHPDSFTHVIHDAVFIGGDTDTIASMAGAISGAFLGSHVIPTSWLGAVREERYTVAAVQDVADRLFAKCARP
ncbi:MAG TPA: ADP-ribosylglycohydrolase family protein [Tepidisphaeraceae bacterium]|nr:ADP-ribosylglycohydrolase family protein [Tepidisphaeraceae bacterium]